ncbi:NPCBM/NEW2 domain-containing protein [Streptomyces fuscigenes]|uniref:NPCBM/NEW2 domain-containing protein n=1 Tax=Streptomyces fuscigenes TaxID=1528880 RepID=UPI001F2154B8|nr:NPCBM/NEW2 domain-containing protein [Streptomyces fuscigenes]MCF3961113.1 NPCBM/NEW2 domain-containing protein [Streptomyces fuscigenes]
MPRVLPLVWRLTPLWVLVLLAALLTATTAAPAHAAPDTSIGIDGGKGGRTFDGIGAISGGGGNSRLLTDYPAAQQKQILDYLFKPGYGANLQLLKLEIGGDANSTDGSEPSIEHTKGKVDCDAGYEFWLAEQAKKRNPHIGLYGLAWAAPGWIDGGFWSTDTIDYLITWLGCAKQHGLDIEYLGGWNERGHDAGWYVRLRSALDAAGYSRVRLVADDSGWDVADDMAKDPAFGKAVSIIGAHYPCQGDGGPADTCSSTQTAQDSGKPLWASENGSQDMNTGAPALIRSITRGYVDAKMTSYFNWPLLAAIYPNLPYSTVGLATAGSPWSGNYSVGANTWATAQVTQFAQPGWSFVDSASGHLGGSESNGSYVTLRSPGGKDYSTVLETTSATDTQTAHFSVTGGLSTGTVHVWATDVNHPSPATEFVHTEDIRPSGGAYSLTMRPGYIYTVTTTTGQGKGTATAPAAHPLALPYTDTYDHDAAGTEARYLSDMQGSFEVQKCAAGRRGMCLQQMAATKPIEWQDDSDAFTLVGDPTWSDYSLHSDVELARPGTVELIGRAGLQNRPQSHQQGYLFQISDTGVWTILKSDANGVRTVLSRSATTPLGTGTWHRLGLSFSGSTITASVDGKDVGVAHDGSYTAGQGGLGLTSYDTDQFDNLSFQKTAAARPSAQLALTPSAKSVRRGKPVDVTATFSVPAHAGKAEGITIGLTAPGFTFDGQPQVFGEVAPGHSAVATWTLTAPTDKASTADIGATATYARGGVAQWLRQDTQVAVTNPPPPSGVTDVSSLDFVASTNGWGPVERDQSVGGTNPDDGTPLTIGGTVYAKGLGTNAVSDVTVYLGGACSSFSSTVGNDDDAGNQGSMTFSVVGDGKTLASTKTVKGGDPAQKLTADVSGVQTLDLVVGDAGDGNAYDHGDWAAPTLTCTG